MQTPYVYGMPKLNPLKPRPATAYVKFWIDDTAINFNLNVELRDALDDWKRDELIFTRTEAVKLMIDIVVPGEGKRIDRLRRYAAQNKIGTWSGAIRAVIKHALLVHRGPANWTAPSIAPAD